MSSLLTIIALLLLLAVAAVLFIAARKPTTFRIERSVTIAAPAERIFPLINDVRTMNGWSPFTKTDPSIRITYDGPASGKGAAHNWDSTGRAGKGRLEIIDATPPSVVDLRLLMSKPMSCDNRVRFTLAPAGSATTVTWAMTGPWPYLHRIMGTVFNTDKMVGGEFEKGLRDLKRMAEGAG
jgi:uncharacterized protein YndB with AHSA1/START domain